MEPIDTFVTECPGLYGPATLCLIFGAVTSKYYIIIISLPLLVRKCVTKCFLNVFRTRHEWHRWVVGSPNSERCVRMTWVEIETQLRARGYCKAGEFKGAYPRWCLSGAKWSFEARSRAQIVYVCVCVWQQLKPCFLYSTDRRRSPPERARRGFRRLRYSHRRRRRSPKEGGTTSPAPGKKHDYWRVQISRAAVWGPIWEPMHPHGRALWARAMWKII